jgi:hypothetical protein
MTFICSACGEERPGPEEVIIGFGRSFEGIGLVKVQLSVCSLCYISGRPDDNDVNRVFDALFDTQFNVQIVQDGKENSNQPGS